jgi:hypothetical protein
MASKKYLLLMAVACFTAISSFSQVKIGTTYDSSQIPDGRMKQHNEFLQGTYNFPANHVISGKLVLKEVCFRFPAIFQPSFFLLVLVFI